MLTDLACRRAVCPVDKPYARFSDSGGLYLEVSSAGGKSWRWKYRHEGKEKRLTIGRYPAVSVQDARRARDEARDTLARGIDPSAQKQREGAAVAVAEASKFEAVARRWHAKWGADKNVKYAAQVITRLEADIFAALGARDIRTLTAPDFVLAVKKVEARGAGESARRLLETSGRIMRFAVAEGLADRDPTKDVSPVDVFMPRQEVNHARVGLEAFPRLLRDMVAYQGTWQTRAAMQLMAMTFVRTSELIGARWQEFDGDMWLIPPERMKKGRVHAVPLSRQAMEVLAILRGSSRPDRVTGEWYLFPGKKDPLKCMSNNTILKALERMGYKHVMTGHGYRGVASTALNEFGFRHDVIEEQLSHLDPSKKRRAYNHAKYMPERRKMMQSWSDQLDEWRWSGVFMPMVV